MPKDMNALKNNKYNPFLFIVFVPAQNCCTQNKVYCYQFNQKWGIFKFLALHLKLFQNNSPLWIEILLRLSGNFAELVDCL